MSSGTGKEGKIVSLGGDPEVGHLGLDMAVTKNSFYFLDSILNLGSRDHIFQEPHKKSYILYRF